MVNGLDIVAIWQQYFGNTLDLESLTGGKLVGGMLNKIDGFTGCAFCAVDENDQWQFANPICSATRQG